MVGTRTKDDHDVVREENMSSRRDNSGKPETKKNPSVVSLAMARTTFQPAGVSSMDSEELTQGLHKGVLLDEDGDKVVNGNLQKFWIDEKLHKNCIKLLARSLRITWGSTPEYWTWFSDDEECFGGPVKVDVARLLNVCWLEIWGQLSPILLSPNATYDVFFKLKMEADASGWNDPVNLTLQMPNGTKQAHRVDLASIPKEEWNEIHLGEFVAYPNIYCDFIRVSLISLSNNWKSGLVVKGVIFRPKQ